MLRFVDFVFDSFGVFLGFLDDRVQILGDVFRADHEEVGSASFEFFPFLLGFGSDACGFSLLYL